MVNQRIVLFGGTFDPIHIGHTRVAAESLEFLEAEKVIFIPAKRSPLKSFFPEASDEDRIKMIKLAIENKGGFEISSYELKMQGPSYTIETVRQFIAEYGTGVAICWLVGADSIEELGYWYKMEELIDECNVCVMYRGGYEKPEFGRFEGIWGKQRVEKLEKNVIPTSQIDISSTEIRRRMAEGKSISGMVAEGVADYILEHGLYRSAE